VRWRDAGRGPLRSDFVALRVRLAHDAQRDDDGLLPERWLLAEWPRGKDEPVKYWLSNLPVDADQPVRGARQAALARRTRLPRAQAVPGPGSLRRTQLPRPASPPHLIDAAVAERGVARGTLTLGSDNGTAFTSRAFRARLAQLAITHRRGGYRDPERQAFIESWFSKLKQRCVWREEFETLDEARYKIGAYIDRYHHRPHSGLAYRTPREVTATCTDHDDQSIPAA
jgi:transposase InsO family protein